MRYFDALGNQFPTCKRLGCEVRALDNSMGMSFDAIFLHRDGRTGIVTEIPLSGEEMTSPTLVVFETLKRQIDALHAVPVVPLGVSSGEYTYE